jgi:hypothetical protein
MMLRLDGHLVVVRGSIAKGVFVGHRGDFEDFAERRSSGRGLERVYASTDVP